MKSSMAPLYIYRIYSSKAIERSVTKETYKFVVLGFVCWVADPVSKSACSACCDGARNPPDSIYIYINIMKNKIHSTWRSAFRENEIIININIFSI